MSVAIPERILNYRISATTPTDELLTLRHIYSEVGSYASTILDREHTALSKKCATRLNRVEKQLSSRHNFMVVKEEGNDRYAEVGGNDVISTGRLDGEVLSALTIDELYNLYCGWHLRHRKREAEGREHMTFYYEGKIVRELQRRKPADKGEQLKIDYCTITYHNELENLAFIFSLPVSSQPTDMIYPESDRTYTPSELLALIKLYSHYRTISERELLIEYVDMALDLMSATETSTDKVAYMAIASELVEIGRKGIIRVPGWVSVFLEEAIKAARKDKTVRESDLVLPLLTLQLQNGSSKLEREVCRIVNRCYRRATEDVTLNDLYIAVSCCDYASRFSVRKMGKAWNRLVEALLEAKCDLTTQEIIRLLKVADEIGDYVVISVDSKNRLTEMITERVKLNDIEARACLVTLPTPMAKAV